MSVVDININMTPILISISLLIFPTVPPDKSPPHLREVSDGGEEGKGGVLVLALDLHEVVVEQVLQFEH